MKVCQNVQSIQKYTKIIRKYMNFKIYSYVFIILIQTICMYTMNNNLLYLFFIDIIDELKLFLFYFTFLAIYITTSPDTTHPSTKETFF